MALFTATLFYYEVGIRETVLFLQIKAFLTVDNTYC